MTALASLAP